MIKYALKDLFKKDSIDKQFTIEFDDGKITNEELHSQSFALEESICSEEELRFGCCEASSVSFTVSNIFSKMSNKRIKVNIVLDGNKTQPFAVGEYIVKEDRPTADRTKREIVAYDFLCEILNANVATWYNQFFTENNSDPKLKDFRDGFFQNFGISQKEISLPNDEMKVEKTIQTEELIGGEVLNAICELNGCFGKIGREGSFEYIFLRKHTDAIYPSDDLFPGGSLLPSEYNYEKYTSDDYQSGGCDYQDYVVQKITGIEIRQDDESAGALAGSTENVYTIKNNFLTYGKSTSEMEAIAQNILEQVKEIEYRPFDMNTFAGNPCVETGDPIKIYTKNQIIESYILKRRITGIQSLSDEISASGAEKRGSQISGLSNTISQLKGKTNRLERTAEETLLKIENLEKETSTEIQQLAESVAVTVNSKGDVITSLDIDKNGMTFIGNRLVISTDNFELDEEGNVKILGEVVAKEGLSIYSTYSNEFFKLIEFTFESSDDQTIRFKDMYGDDFITIAPTSGNTFIGDISGNAFTAQRLTGYVTCKDRVLRTPVGCSNEQKRHANYVRTLTNSNGVTRLGINGGYDNDTDSTLYVTVETSDERFKTDVSDTEVIALDLINQIKHRQFTWKKQNSHQNIGYIAQELEKIEKRMVIAPENDDEYYQVNSFYMMGLATKAIQELSNENKKLKEEIGELKKSVSFLMEKLGGILSE